MEVNLLPVQRTVGTMTQCNEWGYTPEQWSALTARRRYRIKNRKKINEQQRLSYQRLRAAQTPEQRQEVNRKRRARLGAPTEEKRRMWRLLWSQRSTEQLAKQAARMRTRRKNMSHLEREIYNRKARERMAYWYANLSPEEKRERLAKGAKQKRERLSRMSIEQRDELWEKRNRFYKDRRLQHEGKKADIEALRIARIPLLKIQNRLTFDTNPTLIYNRIRQAIPRHLPADIRDDLSLEMSVALLEGELAFDEIEASAKKFVTKHYRDREWHLTLSYDQIQFNDDKTTWAEKIDSRVEHF